MSASAGMTFKRYGRSYHLLIRTAEDLKRVLELDEAHWVATGAPISTINCDATFLALVDTDRNGRIMCFEVKDAISWLFMNLADAAGVVANSQVLRLEAVNAGRVEGQRICESASKMLMSLGKPDAGEISLDEVRRVKAEVESTPVSEAGVVLPEAPEDEQVRQFLLDIIATVGGAPHPSGKPGVGQAQFESFLTEARAHLDWLARGEVPDGQDRTEVMPLGADTPAAFGMLASIREKVDQYFAQCEAVAFDGRTGRRMGLTEEELSALDFDDPAVIHQTLAEAPLSKPRGDRTLSFSDPMNSRHAERAAVLRAKVIEPVLGRGAAALSEPQWEQVKGVFAAHEAWATGKGGPAVEPLGAEKLRTYLREEFGSAVRALIAERARTAFVLDNIGLVEKLILYQAYLGALVNNFVSFPHLYNSERRAMFEMGTLVMDRRRFNLSVRVENRAAHSGIARTSNMYVLYVEILTKEGEKRYEVAVPVTSGGKGNLCVGKRGVFEDVDGKEWDARVAQIIENPISIGEALVSPFQRIAGMVTGKIEALTAQAEKKLDATTAGTLAAVEKGAPPAAPAAPRASQGAMAGGLLMGGGVAVAAVGSAVAYFTKTMAGLKKTQILLGLGCAVLAVILPTSIIAYVKLRRRDLSAILEGSGWAVNARMRLTRGQCRFFTRTPRYPATAKGIRRLPWWAVAAAIMVAAAVGGELVRRWRGRRPSPPRAAITTRSTTSPSSPAGVPGTTGVQPSQPKRLLRRSRLSPVGY